MSGFGFALLARDGAARRGRITTAHGTIETPSFITIGTAATVKAMRPEDVAATGAEIVPSATNGARRSNIAVISSGRAD